VFIGVIVEIGIGFLVSVAELRVCVITEIILFVEKVDATTLLAITGNVLTSPLIDKY